VGSGNRPARKLIIRFRVLKPNGVYFIVSYGTPENRLHFLEKEEYSWKVKVHTVRKCASQRVAIIS
jgi:hypothetical protein